MSLELYDKALEKKLKSIFANVVMAPPDDAFTRSNKDGKVKLPLISAWRMSNPINFEEYNSYEAFTGRRSARFDDHFLMTQGIPVTITYQIDIWASLRSDADGIFRELVAYLLIHPNLEVEVPNETSYDFSLKLTDTDTSTDYASFTDKNIVHRYTLTYEIDTARLFFQHDGNKFIESIDVSLSVGGEDNG